MQSNCSHPLFIVYRLFEVARTILDRKNAKKELNLLFFCYFFALKSRNYMQSNCSHTLFIVYRLFEVARTILDRKNAKKELNLPFVCYCFALNL